MEVALLVQRSNMIDALTIRKPGAVAHEQTGAASVFQ